MHDAEHCGCSHTHHAGLTEAQGDFLHHLEHHHYLPVARFLAESSVEDFSNVALSPVYLRSADEDMKAVKETAAMLLELESAGYLTLDYDCPLDGYAYEEYSTSALYTLFCQTIEEGKTRPGFLCDTPRLELGSIAPCAQKEP